MSTATGQLALPPAAPPAPRRQLFIGTALGCVAGTMMLGGMLAIWVLLRERVVDGGGRFPVDYIIPEVATNVMLMTVWALCLFAQWAVYSGSRGDRAHTALALGVTGLLAIAFINAQAFVYVDMGVVIDDDLLRHALLRHHRRHVGTRDRRPRVHRRRRLPGARRPIG